MTTPTHITAEQWFSQGERVPYDPRGKRILRRGESSDSPELLHVFQRVVSEGAPLKNASWTTFLPGFPDGSYGWARVEQRLATGGSAPKLFVEYVGQGDSDKPDDYPYSTMERADLVEATWQALGITSTFVVTFDYSSLALLELLSRQQDRIDNGHKAVTRIEKVLIVNGGLFADGHSHPWATTPLLKTPVGKMGTWVAQRSRFAFDQVIKSMWSKDYKVTSEELGEVFDAIGRRNGAAFMSNAAGFVDEHKANAERWDLRRVFLATRDSVEFHVVGSERDQFEPNQIVKARERLGEYGLDVRVLPGGHMTTSEQPEPLAKMIQQLSH